MAVLPRKKNELLQWFANRLDTWGDVPADIGLTAEQVTTLTTLLTNAQTAEQQAEQARIQARDLTDLAASELETLHSVGSQAVQTIRAFAKASADPAAVYSNASVPAPAARRPLPTPSLPENFRFALQTDGSIQISWQAESRGVVYILQRQVTNAQGETGPWETISTQSGKSHTDESLPVGTLQAAYQIRAMRGNKQSRWSDPAVVRFVTPDAQTPPTIRLAA